MLSISLKNINSAYDNAKRLYKTIYNDLKKRKLLTLKTKKSKEKLSEAELSLLEEFGRDLADVMGLNYDDLLRLTGSPFLTVKMLMSQYRRVRDLVDYQRSNKAFFK